MKENGLEKLKIFFAGTVAGYLTFYWIILGLFLVGVVDFSTLKKLLPPGRGYNEFEFFLLLPIVVLVNTVFFKGRKELKMSYLSAYLFGVMIAALAIVL